MQVIARFAFVAALTSAACASPPGPAASATVTPRGSTVVTPGPSPSPSPAPSPSLASSSSPGPAADPFAPPLAGKPCALEGYRPPAGAKVELGTRVSGTRLAVGLTNAGSAPVCVVTHIATHEVESDWLRVSWSAGGAKHELAFDDSRDKSYPVSVELAPGETRWVSFDLAAWQARKRNGGGLLTAGHLELSVSYDTTRETDVWAGRLSARAAMDVP